LIVCFATELWERFSYYGTISPSGLRGGLFVEAYFPAELGWR
jgi:hypothetical protein